MDAGETIRWCASVLQHAGLVQKPTEQNFLKYTDTVRDILDTWPDAQLEQARTHIENLRRLRDDLDSIVRADPACLYTPAHHVAVEFHQSKAKIRYATSGNRTSKTQTAAIDNYWRLTGQHPYLPPAHLPTSIFIIGIDYAKYGPNVFEPKYLYGEAENTLSPLFPEGGKWLHSYDPKKYTIYLACPTCAQAGTAKKCKHPKSRLSLFSDGNGPMVLQGGQYVQGQFDEQIRYEFLAEAQERLKLVPHSSLLVTETPMLGKANWTYSVLEKLASGPVSMNTTEDGRPFVSLHRISQFDAGLAPHADIRASMKTLSEAQIAARIYGLPVMDTAAAVFDTNEIYKMRDETSVGTTGRLELPAKRGAIVEQLQKLAVNETSDRAKKRLIFTPDNTGMLTIWEPPSVRAQYIIGVDVAKGLTKRDASCAQVFKLTPYKGWFQFTQVAVLHGWMNPIPYANQVFLLGYYYNNAPTVIERNGPGDSLIYQLVKVLNCWFVLRDISSPAAVREMQDPVYGVDTNIVTKGAMISLLQTALKDVASNERVLTIRDEQTLSEFESYIQETTAAGHTTRFLASGTSHDDRVMAAAVAVYATKVCPLAYDPELAKRISKDNKYAHLSSRERIIWKEVHEHLDTGDDPFA